GPAARVEQVWEQGGHVGRIALDRVHAAGTSSPPAVSHSRPARHGDAGGVPVMACCGMVMGRCRITEETVMTVAKILNQKGTAVVTARPDDTVHEVGKLLSSRKVGAVVIIDGEAIAGIVSERDIVRAIAEHGETAL